MAVLRDNSRAKWAAVLDGEDWHRGKTKNVQMNRVYIQAHSLGIPEAEARGAVRQIIEAVGGDFRPEKDQRQWDRARDYAGSSNGVSRSPYKAGAAVPKPRPEYRPELLEKAAGEIRPLEEIKAILREASPTWATSSDNFLRQVYGPGEIVKIFRGRQEYQGDEWHHTPTPEGREIGDRLDFPDGVWYLCQPVDGREVDNPQEPGKTSTRCSANVTAFRYAVLESDDADPAAWLTMLTRLPLRVVAIYTSGKRSIHALVRVDADTKDKWDAIMEPHKAALIELGADRGALSAVRLSRLPLCYRNGQEQELIYLNPDADSWPIIGEQTAGDQWEAFAKWFAELKGCAEYDEARPAEIPPGTMILPSDQLTITASAQAIFSQIAESRRMFWRADNVVEAREIDGETILAQVGPAEFRSRLEDFGPVLVHRIGRNGESVLKPTLCPRQTAEALLAATPARSLPRISLVTPFPLLIDEDGEPVLLDKGWHPEAGGTLVAADWRLDPPELPDAVARLAELFGDFNFPSAGDRARAYGLLLTIAMRAAGLMPRSVPLFTIEADASQTGKGYITKTAAEVFGLKLALVGQKNGGVGSIDESVAARLIEGRPLIVLDNFRGKLDSPYLEAVLTAEGLVPARIPHRAEMSVDARRTTFLATSNGFFATSDLSNRLAMIRLRKHPRNYRFKKWPEGDLLNHIAANRAQYLSAVYAVISEWICEGKPRTDEDRHSFREWSQPIDWICRNLLDVGPLLDGHTDAAERTANPARQWLREVAMQVLAAGREGEALSATLIGELCEEANLPPPGAREDWAGVEKTVGITMARLFTQAEAEEIDADVARVVRERHITKDQNWRPKELKSYLFHRK